jgi:hypothetical protein
METGKKEIGEKEIGPVVPIETVNMNEMPNQVPNGNPKIDDDEIVNEEDNENNSKDETTSTSTTYVRGTDLSYLGQSASYMSNILLSAGSSSNSNCNDISYSLCNLSESNVRIPQHASQ